MANSKGGRRGAAPKSPAARARSGNPAVRSGSATAPKRGVAPKTGATAKVAPAKKIVMASAAKPAPVKVSASSRTTVKPKARKLDHAAGIEAGDKAPAFTLKTTDGEKVSLSSLKRSSRKGTIVFFFPTAKSKASLTQVTDFRDAYAAFQKAGFAVIGLAPDHHGDLEKLRVEHKLPYPLAEDVGSKVARKYGAYGPTHKYGITATLPDELHRLAPRVDGTLRSTFIIDADGVVDYVAARFTAKGHVFRLKKRLGVA